MPKNNAVEIVAPEREKPLKGKHKACTAPITIALDKPISPCCPRSKREDRIIKTPAAAKAAAINLELLNKCSISKLLAPPKNTCLIKACNNSPNTPVIAVAIKT